MLIGNDSCQCILVALKAIYMLRSCAVLSDLAVLVCMLLCIHTDIAMESG